MFDSPLHFCTVCREYVALDESLKECAARHHCDVQLCPIAALFVQAQHPQQLDDAVSRQEVPRA